jgi:hypothetical protein
MDMRIVLALLSALALALPAAAAAQTQNAPPGNSGVDEYLETVPSAGGNRPPHRGEHKPSGSTLSPAARKALESQGKDGQRVAAIVEATDPTSPSHKKTATGDDVAPTPRSADLQGSGDSALHAVLSAAGGADSGMGFVFPLLIAGTLALVAVSVLLRRRASR